MHAEAADVHVSVRLHHVESLGGEFFLAALVHRKVGVWGKRFQGVGRQEVTRTGPEQSVDELARNNTSLAANAASGVNKNRFAHYMASRGSACNDNRSSKGGTPLHFLARLMP